MKRIYFILILALLIPVACSKVKNVPTSGIATINNKTTFGQTYYVYGFLFSRAELVSTLDTPPPDITIESDGTNLYLQTNTLADAFHKAGEYSSATEASEAFKNLTSADVTPWIGLATPVHPNQVWVYRSRSEHYAKMRIISTISEVREGRDYAECSFEWVYQPDGSLTFPGK